MTKLTDLHYNLAEYYPMLVVAAAAVLLLWLTHWFLLGRKKELTTEARLPRQVLLLVLTAAALLIVLLVVPMTDTTRAQVLGLIGIVITGIIAFSSTTFVANMMAGLMLRAVKSFRAGDFIRVGDNFGRVTDRGLFHIEIQSEDRDLITLPNMLLVTNPVTVVHSTGTIISATLSLGYEHSHARIEDLLKQAAEKAGLEDAFVHIRDLNDYSVSYKVAGFLAEVKHLLSVRSSLRREVLDALHGHGIEIVSPVYMNQRALTDKSKSIPKEYYTREKRKQAAQEPPPEEVIFDKAEEAAAVEKLVERHQQLAAQLVEMKKSKKAATRAAKPRMAAEIAGAKLRLKQLAARIEEAKARAKNSNGG